MALVALYPLALNMLLKGDIELHFSAPEEIISRTDIREVEEEINGVMRKSRRATTAVYQYAQKNRPHGEARR